MRMASIGVLVLAGTLPCLLGAAPPPDGDKAGLSQIDLLPVAASSAKVDIGGRAYRVWISIIQPVSTIANDPPPPAYVSLWLTPLDGKAVTGTVDRPVVTLTYGRRNVRLVLTPSGIASANSANFQSEAALPWATGTKLQAKIELKVGKGRATVRMDRVAISVVGPTL